MTEQAIKRGLLQTFDPLTYTATILILEATSYVLTSVPIATSIDGTSAISGASCAVLFLDTQNPTDAVIIAVYGSAPASPPGRVTFVTPIQQINASTINSATINTYTMSGLPGSILGILFKAFFTCSLSGTSIFIAPHGGTMADYCTIGNLSSGGATLAGNGIVPVDASGRVDIQANNGNCTVTLYTYGYII
jgi:hypothetical protein